MSNTFRCGETSGLISYLYDEGEPEERAAIQAHVEVCAACAAELMALEATRDRLASWTPPEAKLGFSIQSSLAGASPPRSSGFSLGPWLRQPLPAWAQVAAAALVFTAGLSIGLVRGSGEPGAPPVVAARTVTSRAETPSVSARDLGALEARLREEIAGLRTTAPDDSAASGSSEAQILARVRALIDDSEQRQRRELALRTAEIVRDFDVQRRIDLAQIQRTFGQIEGVTGAEVRQQRQMLNYLMRVSQQP